MNDTKLHLIRVLTELCEALYMMRRASHAEFLIDAHNDMLDVARAIVSGTSSQYFMTLAEGYADGVDVNEWAADALQENHAFVAARIGLAKLYKDAVAAIAAAPEGQEAAVAGGVLQTAQADMGLLSGGDASVEEWLNGEFSRIAVNLGLAPAPAPEVVETVYEDGAWNPGDAAS